MNEDYVSYDLALKLKACGFDEPCIAQWACEPDGKPMLVGSTAFVFDNAGLKGRDVTAPFLWQAQKWLREKKDIVITIDFCPIDDSSMIYTYTINRYNPDGGKNIGDCWEVYCSLRGCGCCYSGGWDFYEEALSAGIAAALEMLYLPFTKQKQ